jgi:hypothetical protein
LMFKAVEKFGPRWNEPVVDPKCLKPNGEFDFGKCTENSGVRKGEIVWPSADKANSWGRSVKPQTRKT